MLTGEIGAEYTQVLFYVKEVKIVLSLERKGL